MYAFPNVHDPKTGSMTHGMTLRDYFAAQAVQGVLTESNLGFTQEDYGHLAKICYSLADAMMKAREA